MIGHLKGCVCQECVERKRAAFAFQRPAMGAGVPKGYPTAEAGDTMPPLGNTGETLANGTGHTVELVSDNGKIKEVTIRRPSAQQCVVIDTLRFTVHQNTFLRTEIIQQGDGSLIIGDDDFIKEASRVFADIFGFGVTKNTGKGRDFYRDSYILGDGFGYVCIGNQGKNDQKQTILVELSGLGCINATEGWEARLQDFLQYTALRPVLTRIDLAHDDLQGERISPDWAESEWLSGGFSKQKNKHPNIERAGNWHAPTGAGRTLYIGSRKSSSMFVRCYEKGKEQGDPTSPWVRLELELKNADRVIPFDILTRPSDYFVAAYPCFLQFSNYATPETIVVKRNKAKIAVDAAKDLIKKQYGKYLKVIRDIVGNDEVFLNEVCADDGEAWPERLRVVASFAEAKKHLWLHLQTYQVPKIDAIPADVSFLRGGFNEVTYAS